MVKTLSGRMAKPEDESGYTRAAADAITLYIENALAGEEEIEFLIPNVGTFVMRRA